MTTTKAKEAKDMVMDETEEEVEEAVTSNSTKEKYVMLSKRSWKRRETMQNPTEAKLRQVSSQML